MPLSPGLPLFVVPGDLNHYWQETCLGMRLSRQLMFLHTSFTGLCSLRVTTPTKIYSTLLKGLKVRRTID